MTGAYASYSLLVTFIIVMLLKRAIVFSRPNFEKNSKLNVASPINITSVIQIFTFSDSFFTFKGLKYFQVETAFNIKNSFFNLK